MQIAETSRATEEKKSANKKMTAVIPGCKNVVQVESNASAADLAFVRDDHPQAVA